MLSNWISDLSALSDRIFGLMKSTAENSEFDVGAQDSRLVALSGMKEAVLSASFWLKTYNSIANVHQDEEMILLYAGSNISLEETSKVMLTQLRLGLVVFFHFKLECFLRSLLEEVSNGNYKRSSLSLMFPKLASEVGLSNVDTKEDILKAFSSIRNSLHNNGIHTHPSFRVVAGDFEYDFKEGQPAQCASLSHSINLIELIVDILEKVLESEKIRALRDPIPEKFTEWLE